MANKKDFTSATSSAANKFFTGSTKMDNQIELDTQESNVTNIGQPAKSMPTKELESASHTNNTEFTNITLNTKQTHVTNKSKHYDVRGKREERFGILIDPQLKEDLRNLSNATGAKSINDFIFNILLTYVEQPESQQKLKKYKELLELR